MELWWEPRYHVSKNGVVTNTETGNVLKPYKQANGYLRAGMTFNNKSRNMFIHRMVAMKYIKNPKGKRNVNHKNLIKDDNRVENLEWVHQKENAVHAVKNGAIPTGDADKRTKLSSRDVAKVREMANQGIRHKIIAEKFSISKGLVSAIKNGKKRKHCF